MLFQSFVIAACVVGFADGVAIDVHPPVLRGGSYEYNIPAEDPTSSPNGGVIIYGRQDIRDEAVTQPNSGVVVPIERPITIVDRLRQGVPAKN
ncbi:hypothetical protein K438DRAFT_1957272 [Mycena galopus ATCC 62051]|nr:hypothetical protein K438DRAFT_1957272 [Mycena galopus ATCC 62051]